jgi:hypothetical protein
MTIGKSIFAALWLSLTLAACAEPVSTATKPCPCASGYVCCESGVCASEAATCGAATAALSTEAQGRWTGYVEGTDPMFGEDSIDLTLHVDAAGALTGQIVFGEGPPPAPTDPQAAWPGPGKGGFVWSETDYVSPFVGLQPVVGVPLTARDIRWEAGRLRFTVELVEAWAPWCALQTPLLAARGDYTCAPEITIGRIENGIGLCFPNSESPPIDCRWSTMCSARICDCTATGCGGRALSDPLVALPIFHFDIALRGDEGDGSLNTSTNVRLVRSAH